MAGKRGLNEYEPVAFRRLVKRVGGGERGGGKEGRGW